MNLKHAYIYKIDQINLKFKADIFISIQLSYLMKQFANAQS